MVRDKVARIALISCVAALTACAGVAAGGNNPSGGGPVCAQQRDIFSKLESELGLNDAQKAKAEAIVRDNSELERTIAARLRTERTNLHELMRANSVDEAAIRAETFSVASIQADLNVIRAMTLSRFRAILRPTQSENLKVLLQKWAAEEPPERCSK